MVKQIVKIGIAVAVAAGGLVALSSATAGAAKITITAGPGSSASCSLAAKAKLSPALKNNWVASPSDSVPAVAALPNTQFASAGPVMTTAKATATCTGTATDGTHSTTITGVKKLTITVDPAHPGSTGEASCSSLLGGSTAEFNTTIQWVGSSAKIANTTVTDSVIGISGSPIGFTFSGGTVTGSFAGGSVASLGAIGPDVVAAVTQAQETGAQAVTNSYTSLGCEPTLKVKTNAKGVTTASFKAPKGFKQIVVTSGSTLTAAG